MFNKIRNRLGKKVGDSVDYLTDPNSPSGKLLEYAGRPNAAIKSGLMDYAKRGSITGAMGAAGDQISEPTDSAPSGYDVAEALGSKFNIESPAALTAMSVAAEMADVPMVGPAAKVARMAKKGAKAGDRVADVTRAAKLGKSDYPMSSPEDFYEFIERAKSTSPMHAANISDYSKRDYEDFRTFLSPDKKSGYAIKPDGELISVASLEKGRGANIVDDAILNKGAKKLDAFDIEGKLPNLYGKYMDETDRIKFGDEYDDLAGGLGRPDVVQMELNPEKVRRAQLGEGFGSTIAPDIEKYKRLQSLLKKK